ncbi:N-acetylmuramoyl-L-alanine amidase [Bengtsoniella intestinalis]|uniref:N-acetylmuramoyl-L-alanine amidase n=1 Tax=Bengtsoniella intestinalis TaxID=3073143 RepID=UPI00391F68DF
MWIVIGKWRLLGSIWLITGMFVAVISITFVGNEQYIATFAIDTVGAPMVIVDAGHGGEDGGAVSDDGVIESQLNLAIATKLYQTLQLIGIPSLMTRETDISLHDGDAQTIREKKVSDLENRVALINTYPQSVVLSVHQNSLPTSPVTHGAQCFYNHVAVAKPLAAAVQYILNETVNIGNEKNDKSIGTGIYLMDNATVPVVIIECGFLTNSDETALLQTQQHQMTLALSITVGYGQSLEIEDIT